MFYARNLQIKHDRFIFAKYLRKARSKNKVK